MLSKGTEREEVRLSKKKKRKEGKESTKKKPYYLRRPVENIWVTVGGCVCVRRGTKGGNQ